ncbi:hypothetical protein PPTG_18450 [Phytophthora nicotianae INRA-310]|uniref:CCHC-type domain-containing protein n=1 Tax=Phytophthora nicotianae (strain INRA-310) TaxID=761204 RepID=W2PGZ9_PHYN3|nr:hypothetical protein PPTG_18450 [Phytophthora nicotianae INRA-310]ETM99910.1 hypothetical protein PPTG_18450 [Phytophthora nicotianae INRA-310]
MPSRNSRISNASAQYLRTELDEVAEVETRVQHQRWWSLRFEHPVMEQRFQIYYEESSIVSSKWACGVTLGSAAALQAAVFYDTFTLKSHERTPWVFVDIAVAGNALLLLLWGIFLWTARRRKRLGAYFQIMIFVLGLSMLLLILVLGLPLAAYETEAASISEQQDLKILAELDEARKAHDVTRTMFFLLMLLGAIATTWSAQFLAYCALATCTLFALGGWIIGCSDYLRRQWHLVALFICSLFLLGRVIYCGERNLRNKFLRARRLMLENLKLSRQNSVMHQQLSCHVNAVGIGNGRHSESRAATSNGGSRVLPQKQRSKIRPKNGHATSDPPAIGESWMENVLRSLVQLRQRLQDDEQTTGELDFVLQALTSEHDLFLDTWSRQRRVPAGEKAGTGWLSLLEEKRNRRRKTEGKQQQIPSTLAFLTKALRRTSSGSRMTVLTLLENYLPPPGDNKSSEQKYWPPDELLSLSATCQELDLFAFAQSCTVPLTTLLLTTLESHNVFVTLPLRIESVADFAQEIEHRYQPKNPYHNALHAASVRSGAPAVRGGSAFTAATHGKPGVKKGKCFNCGKRGHFKNECKAKKRLIGASGGGNNSQGNSGGAESGFVFMTGARVLLSGLSKMDTNVVVTTANGMKLNATHREKAHLPLATGRMCTLDHVLFVPGLQHNLVSLSEVGTAGLAATFDHERCVITSGKSKLVATRRSSGLYVVEVPSTIRNA